jgi:cell division protease FtsH
MNIIYFYTFFIPTLLAYNNNYKINFANNWNNYDHLDSQNSEKLKKLEEMFYLRKNSYSPFRNMIYLKYANNNNLTDSNLTDDNIRNKKFINITKILESINNQFIKNFKENLDMDYDIDYDNDDINDDNLDYNIKNDINNDMNDDVNIPKKNLDKKEFLEKNGFLDPTGIYRYNRPRSTSRNNNAKSDDEFSNDNNFEIIKNPTHTFKDIGGYEKIKLELLQSADILINYDKYKKYNVRTPKGIIFEGPPGNGKTLMAKGFSGELNVSFIPVSGSEFSEKFVGVGASRVRDLFKLANNNKPCIIFIDEIDALARKRGNDMVSSNSEKDQTLNQLLINLDGFKSSDGIFVIGATNRIDLLDPALIRPGRIDKNIYIGNPDSKTRKDIIEIHLKGKPIHKSITIDQIVEITGGFSGAQIENLLNEAMLHSLREGREMIIMNDLEYIANRVVAGWQASENKYSDDIINRIIIHEMGHALVGFFSPDHANLVKVTLNLWSPKTPGYTLFENSDEDANIYTKNGLSSHLMVLLGGRVAEEIFYGYSVTTGAKKDLEQAYSLAQNMILHYGMGSQNIYPDLSDQSKYLIDQEVNKLLIDAHDKAFEILKNSQKLITDCSSILKKTNTLKPHDIINIINKKYPEIWDLCNDIKENYK